MTTIRCDAGTGGNAYLTKDSPDLSGDCTIYVTLKFSPSAPEFAERGLFALGNSIRFRTFFTDVVCQTDTGGEFIYFSSSLSWVHIAIIKSGGTITVQMAQEGFNPSSPTYIFNGTIAPTIPPSPAQVYFNAEDVFGSPGNTNNGTDLFGHYLEYEGVAHNSAQVLAQFGSREAIYSGVTTEYLFETTGTGGSDVGQDESGNGNNATRVNADGFVAVDDDPTDWSGPPPPDDVIVIVDASAIIEIVGANVDVFISPITPTPGAWTQLLPLGSYNGQDYSATQLLVSPVDPAVLFVGIGNAEIEAPLNGVYRSRNYGASWQQISGASTGGPRQVNHLAFPDPTSHDKLLVSDGVRGDTTGIWRTLDGGATWALSGDFLAVSGPYSTDCYSVVTNPNVPGDMLVGYHGAWPAPYTTSGVLRTLDGGDTWTIVPPPVGLTYAGSINVFFLYEPGGGEGSSDRFLYTTEGQGFWVTENAGLDGWTQVTTEGMAHGGSAIYYAPNGDLYAAGAVIQRSVDNGDTWTSVSPGGTFFFLPIAGNGDQLFTHVASAGHEPIQAPLDGPPSSGNWTDLGAQEFSGGAFSLVFDPVTNRLYGSFAGGGGEGVWVYQFAAPPSTEESVLFFAIASG